MNDMISWMKRRFFKTQEDFRKWLEKNHETADELLVGFWKRGSGKRAMTWSESVDQALCFGWIDGVRRRVNDEAYTIRFTPRRANSIWSKINIDKIAELKTKDLMRSAGLAAFEKRKDAKSAIYSYENQPKEFAPEYEKRFQKNKKAWKFFEEQPPGYRRLMIFRVMSAKQEATRGKRLEELIAASAEGKRL
jgi:uncharacterized protein YdeI (YjbR/CyaY-like superfamily)